jgi:hypothetical protein
MTGAAAACPSGKRKFRDELAAKIRVGLFRSRRKHPVRAYRCPLCGSWHITSQSKRSGKN